MIGVHSFTGDEEGMARLMVELFEDMGLQVQWQQVEAGRQVACSVEFVSTAADDVPAVVLAPPGQLHTADGMAGLIDAMRKRFGDTMGYVIAAVASLLFIASTLVGIVLG